MIAGLFADLFRFVRMLIALLLIPAGILMVVKADKVYEFIGDFDWCEKIMGPGGTYSFVKVFGLMVTLVAIMWLTGRPQQWMQDTFSHLFGY